MFLTKTDPRCCTSLLDILHNYETASGQMINTVKSYISFSEHFGRKKRDLLSASIVDKIHQKDVSWNSRFLSTAGKDTILQSVLSDVPSFAMTCFELPVGLSNWEG